MMINFSYVNSIENQDENYFWPKCEKMQPYGENVTHIVK